MFVVFASYFRDPLLIDIAANPLVLLDHVIRLFEGCQEQLLCLDRRLDSEMCSHRKSSRDQLVAFLFEGSRAGSWLCSRLCDKHSISCQICNADR